MSTRARRGSALLLLIAVFGMHGLQCGVAHAGTDMAAHGVRHAFATELDQALHPTGLGPATAWGGAAAAAAPVAVSTTATAELSLPAGHGGAPAGGGHLWALCLAVLTAGLTVLLLLRTGRPPRTRPPRRLRNRARPGGAPCPLRPPDPYSLCLMRI